MRFFVLAACLLAFAAFPTAEAADPIGSCEEGRTVDVCVPVCVTTPCNPYVCTTTSLGHNCIRP